MQSFSIVISARTMKLISSEVERRQASSFDGRRR
jgi:hypothetical protein